MTARVVGAPASARELGAVFAVVLSTAFVVDRVRPPAIAGTPVAAGSYVVSGAVATLAFWALCALGRRRWAWGITALLLVALAASAVGGVASKRLAPRDVAPSVPSPSLLPQLPRELEVVANWLTDRQPVWLTHDSALTVAADGSVVVDGTPATNYATLALARPQQLEGGTYVVVEGVVAAGGVYVGLQRAGSWVDFNTLNRVGPFRKWVIVPDSGEYQLAVVYAAVAGTPTRVELSSLTLWH